MRSAGRRPCARAHLATSRTGPAPPRPLGVRVRRLAPRGGAELVAGAPARATRSPPLPVQGAFGVRGVAGTAGGAACARVVTRAVRVSRTVVGVARRLGALRGPRS